MAIAKLFPNSTTDASSLIATGNHLDIDETSDVTNGDGNFCDTNTNSNSGSFSFGLSDLPGNADTITSATLRVRAFMGGTQTDDVNIYTISATNDGASVTFTAGTDTAETEKTATLTGETVASLNSETITVTQSSYIQEMAPDGTFLRMEFIEIEVDYTETAAGGPNLLTLLGVG